MDNVLHHTLNMIATDRVQHGLVWFGWATPSQQVKLKWGNMMEVMFCNLKFHTTYNNEGLPYFSKGG
jgi:hypothetical protein